MKPLILPMGPCDVPALVELACGRTRSLLNADRLAREEDGISAPMVLLYEVRLPDGRPGCAFVGAPRARLEELRSRGPELAALVDTVMALPAEHLVVQVLCAKGRAVLVPEVSEGVIDWGEGVWTVDGRVVMRADGAGAGDGGAAGGGAA